MSELRRAPRASEVVEAFNVVGERAVAAFHTRQRLERIQNDWIEDAMAYLDPRFLSGNQMINPEECRWESAVVGAGRGVWSQDELDEDWVLLQESLVTYLMDGELDDAVPTRMMDESTGEIWEFSDALAELRATHAEELADFYRQVLTPAKHALERAFDVAVGVMRDWCRFQRHDGAKDEEQFGQILKAWRTAVGAPGVLAAEILGVSAGAVTRYERRSRIPSLTSIEAMVERIAESRNKFESFDSLRAVDAVVPGTIDRLEALAEEKAGLRESIELRLGAMDRTQLSLVDAVVQNPEALTDLVELLESAPLRSLRQAFSDERRRGLTSSSTAGGVGR